MFCQMSTTPRAWYLPSPDTLSGNYPELAVHPRMNFRSELISSYYVTAPITIHLSCHAFVCYACFIFTVSPPLYFPVDPVAAADYTFAEYDYVVDDSTPTVELPGKQCPFTSPTYHLFVYTLSIALGIVAATLYSYSNA